MIKRKKSTTSRATRSAGTGSQRKAAKTSKAKAASKAAVAEYALAAECVVSEVGDLKKRLGALLNERQAVTLDVSALQRIDTAGLQVLAAFVRERETRALRTQWRGSAPALASAARLLGLTSLLGLAGS